jgi:hypothetical protein
VVPIPHIGSISPGSGPTAQASPAVQRKATKGCRAAASYAVVWNNPKIHPPGREKTWVACEEHRQ